MFDIPEIDEFHKTVRLSPLHRGSGLKDPKEFIVIHQTEKGVFKILFSDQKTIKNIEAEVQIFDITAKNYKLMSD